jgi:MtrB/PioB family decaheme-associated outer membrane protein
MKMNSNLKQPALRRTALALALMAIFSTASAEDEVAQLIKPDSVVIVGLGALSGGKDDRAIYGQYNGKRNSDAYAIVDIDWVTRDDATGTWMRIKVADGGLDDREVSFSREKQGAWKYTAEYSELNREYPRTINTGMTGVGTTSPVISRLAKAGTGANVNIGTERKAAGLGYEQWLTPQLQFEANFKNEDKSGARLWGRGYACAAYVCGSSTTTAMNQANFAAGALLLVPEPIDSSTKQIDMRLNYNDDKLLLSFGYYGSMYNNANGSLNPIVPNAFNSGLGVALPGYPAVGNNIIAGGGMSLQNVLQSAMALPPDNQAHQLYLDGSYGFSRTVKANFKIAYTHASQNDNFAANGLTGAPAGVDSLGAKVDTLLTQFGLTARPTSNLSLLANVKYDHREDKTPLYRYNLEAEAATPATTPASYTNNGAAWFNNRTSNTKTVAKVEASYRLSPAWRATLGGDYNEIKREVPTSAADDNVAGLTALRAKTEESGYRLELRRSMSETLNGSLSYSESKRTGSDWTTLSTLDPAIAGTTAANLALINQYCGGKACYGQKLSYAAILALSGNSVFPLSLTDVKRDKWKFSLDWNPTERLNVQLVAEDGKDTNNAPVSALYGGKAWRESGVSLYSLDAGYTLSEKFSLNAYASHGEQTQHINHSTGYMADLHNFNDAAGLGLKFKATSKLNLTATLAYLNDRNKYGVAAASGVSGTTVTVPSAANTAQAAIGLPDATFRQIGLRLAGMYALQPNADLRIDYGYSRVKFYEWQWSNNGVPFTYSDNTTVNMQNRQNVADIAVRYIYRF